MNTYSLQLDSIEFPGARRREIRLLPACCTLADAEKAAAKAAKDHPSHKVFLSIYRGSDGYHGYINRDSASATVRPW